MRYVHHTLMLHVAQLGDARLVATRGFHARRQHFESRPGPAFVVTRCIHLSKYSSRNSLEESLCTSPPSPETPNLVAAGSWREAILSARVAALHDVPPLWHGGRGTARGSPVP